MQKRSTDELVGWGRAQRAQLGRKITQAEFCQAHGVSDATLRKRFGTWSAFSELIQGEGSDRSVRLSGTVSEEERALAMVRDAKRSGDRARRIIQARESDLEREVARLREQNDFLQHVDRPLSAKPIRAPKRRSKLPRASYIMAASDWHLGERVRPEQVGYRNEYNPEIAQERAERYFRSNLVLLNGSRAKWDIDTVVFWLGGDLMTGYIHEEYESENFLSPLEEADLLLDVMSRGLRYMLEKYDVERIVIPTSSGNHGRTHKKKRIQSDFRNSYEFFAYKRLAKEFAHEPRVEFQLGTGYHNVVDIYGFMLRCSHGDAIKSGGGVGGIAPPAYRRIGRMQEAGHAVNLDIIGHFHQANFMRRFFMNGSLIGWNSFADFIGAAPEPPQQISFVVDSDHRVPSDMNIVFVTSRKDAAK